MRAALALALALALIATLTACALPQRLWDKPGGTRQELMRSHSGCLAQAGYGNSGRSINEMGTRDAIYTACMEGEGWTEARR